MVASLRSACSETQPSQFGKRTRLSLRDKLLLFEPSLGTDGNFGSHSSQSVVMLLEGCLQFLKVRFPLWIVLGDGDFQTEFLTWSSSLRFIGYLVARTGKHLTAECSASLGFDALERVSSLVGLRR